MDDHFHVRGIASAHGGNAGYVVLAEGGEYKLIAEAATTKGDFQLAEFVGFKDVYTGDEKGYIRFYLIY